VKKKELKNESKSKLLFLEIKNQNRFLWKQKHKLKKEIKFVPFGGLKKLRSLNAIQNKEIRIKSAVSFCLRVFFLSIFYFFSLNGEKGTPLSLSSLSLLVQMGWIEILYKWSNILFSFDDMSIIRSHFHTHTHVCV
jgi:hypothetical protein